MAVTINLKQILKEQNHHQKDIASAVGTSTRTISNIEKGQYCPSLETALRLAKYLKVRVEDVFVLEE